MTTNEYEALKLKLDREEKEVTQNQGRLEQLKDNAKKTFKVNDLGELKKLKADWETDLDMQKTKKKMQIEKLEAIVPDDVLEELRDEL
ncbi:MAG: hypothetical protein PF518_04710 [Spirochaetaceae bacterium]|nr:hypothetical protein [Spirochaetaceae bacterium]